MVAAGVVTAVEVAGLVEVDGVDFAGAVVTGGGVLGAAMTCPDACGGSGAWTGVAGTVCSTWVTGTGLSGSL